MKHPMKKLFNSAEFNIDYSMVSTFEECLEESIDESMIEINVQDLVKTKNIQYIKLIGKALAKFLKRYK